MWLTQPCQAGVPERTKLALRWCVGVADLSPRSDDSVNPPGRYYEHSGTVPPLGLLLALLFGIIAAVFLAVIYGYAIFYIPFIYLNFFLTVGFGALVGYAVFLGAKVGKVRNPALVLACGALMGLFAEYAGWVSWMYAASKQQALLLAPLDVWGAINELSAKGAWSIFGLTPSGFALWVVWGVEAIMIVGLAAIASWSSLKSLPFCERCRRWAEQKETMPRYEYLTNPDDFKKQLELGNQSAFKTMKRASGGLKQYAEVVLSNCSRCQQMPLVGVDLVTVSVDTKGKESKSKKQVVENLIADSATVEMIRQVAS